MIFDKDCPDCKYGLNTVELCYACEIQHQQQEKCLDYILSPYAKTSFFIEKIQEKSRKREGRLLYKRNKWSYKS